MAGQSTAQSPSAASGSYAAPLPDMNVSVRQVFGIDNDLEVPAYSAADEHVPGIDPEEMPAPYEQ